MDYVKFFALLLFAGAGICAKEEPAPQPLPPAELSALLDRLEKNLGSMKTLATTFLQEKHLSLFNDVIPSDGIVLFRRPDNVRLEFVQPFQSVLIARRDAVARYENVNGNWTQIKLGSSNVIQLVAGQIATWLQGRFRDESALYEISALGGAETIVVLTPKSQEFLKHIVTIELAVSSDEKRVTRVVIREPEGNFTSMAFKRELRDAALPDELFNTALTRPAKTELARLFPASEKGSAP
jgi:outer membrane lipoprotein-sorting protein